MCVRRDGWRGIFALLSKYILMRPIWYGDTSVPWRTPQLSVAGVSDDTTVDTARTSATALGGALWPNTANTFELVPKIPPGAAPDGYDSDDIKDYCEKVTHIVREVIDAHESNFHIAHAEYLDDQVVYGTSGIFGEEHEDDDACPITFHSVSIETCVIDENDRQQVDTVYFEHILTARQVVEKYGIENVSDRTRAMYNTDKQDSYVKVIQAMEPRPGGKRGDVASNKPFSSIHMEQDSQKVLKVSGMEDMPVFMTRFRKRPAELYGRSLAMDALPTVKELNVLRRAYSLALEKILDPPLGYYPDMLGGGSEVKIGAGTRTALFSSGRIPDGQQPIFQLLKINEPQVATQRVQELMASLKVKFLVDRLLDFNNETRMTLGEAEMRGDFRNQALGNIFSRQLIEMYNPLIKWVIKVLYRRGLLGLHPVKDAKQIANAGLTGKPVFVIPDIVAQMMDKGKIPLHVRFISPAARAMKADSMMGMEKLMNFILSLHNGGVTDAIDNIDTDKAVRTYQDLCGAPLHIVRSMDDMKKQRTMHAQQLQQQMALQAGEVQAKTQDHMAGAAKKYAQAGIAPGMAPGMQQTQGIQSNAA